MTNTYQVGVATERVVEVEAKNSCDAIRAVLEQMAAEGRTVFGTHSVDRVKPASR